MYMYYYNITYYTYSVVNVTITEDRTRQRLAGGLKILFWKGVLIFKCPIL